MITSERRPARQECSEATAAEKWGAGPPPHTIDSGQTGGKFCQCPDSTPYPMDGPDRLVVC
jgi:hypothetical protein